MSGYDRAGPGMDGHGLASTGAATRRSEVKGSEMTEPDNKDPQSRTEKLESVVDQLDEKVAAEREAQGVPGKPSDRENAATGGSEDEPPD